MVYASGSIMESSDDTQVDKGSVLRPHVRLYRSYRVKNNVHLKIAGFGSAKQYEKA